MKPLPFDMTPLARSLSLAPATRRDSTLLAPPPVREPLADVGTVEPPTVDLDVNLDLVEDAIDVKESTIELPAEEREQPDHADLEPEAARPSEDEATPDRGTVEIAARAPTTPATELRTATYPRHLRAHKGWIARLAQEQIHALATHILARHTEQNLRTLAVTSALAGEGKTTITLALAEKLAKAGKRILVLDLDAHRATLSHECGLDDAAGALQSSDPRDPTNMDFHVYSSDIPGISIMPAGYVEFGADGPPIVSPVHVGVLVLRAIDDYDMVILDCPPLLPVADTHVIGEVVDKALLVVRAGATPRDMLDQAIDEFGREKFLGAVLNRARPSDIPYFREVYGYYRRDSARG
jgi:protein-tyrosine kinase